VHLEANAGCPGGIAVVNSDYQSTNVSVLSPSGALLSESMISSGSAPPGLSAALSGDVVLPSVAPASGRLVLIDRTLNVVSWIELATAAVSAQLSVATGFASNPHDYLEVAASKAYVTRFQTNPHPGSEPNDGGGDILILDQQNFAITGRIELATDGDGQFFPSPSELLAVNGTAWVMLERFDAAFNGADARIVGVASDDDAIAWSLDLPGIANCGAMVRDPTGKRVAAACTGVFADADPAVRSGVVLLDATVEPPVELGRFDVAAVLGSVPGPSLGWASDGTLVGSTDGNLVGGVPDSAYSIDTTSGTISALFDAGTAFVLGSALCSPGCSDSCFLADANAKVLRSWQASGSELTRGHDVAVDPRIGLPPRVLGFLLVK
jgi:hypothetical protein